DAGIGRVSWSADGAFLYFSVGTFSSGRLARVRVSAGERLTVSPTREFGEAGPGDSFKTGPDGRLLRVMPMLDPESPSRLAIVQDWTELLPDRASGGRRSARRSSDGATR
ncbi:MAG: hypothetical protein ACOC5E_01010, partial [Acidobacteriota bacterium]